MSRRDPDAAALRLIELIRAKPNRWQDDVDPRLRSAFTKRPRSTNPTDSVASEFRARHARQKKTG